MAVIDDLVIQLGQIGLWIQAVGLVVVLWIIVQGLTLYFNRKRKLLLTEIDKRLRRVEQKLDKLVR